MYTSLKMKQNTFLVVGIMNNNSKVIKSEDENGHELTIDASLITEFTVEEQRGFASILLVPGQLVSLSRLVLKGKFKKIKVGNSVGGAAAGKYLFDTISKKNLGQVVRFRRNNSCAAKQFIRKLFSLIKKNTKASKTLRTFFKI